MNRNLALEFVRVTEAAALSAGRWIGRGEKNAADQAAVTAMRESFNSIDFDGLIVIGEGEMDEAPMLYIGEKVGQSKGPRIDIACDPLEGTSITAKGGPEAIACIAAAEAGGFLHAPDMYMNKSPLGLLPGAQSTSLKVSPGICVKWPKRLTRIFRISVSLFWIVTVTPESLKKFVNVAHAFV